MPENIKVSIRFVDDQQSTTQNTQQSTYTSFNLYDFFRKYKKNCGECSPALVHINQLTKRLSELEVKLQELDGDNPKSRSRCCRRDNRSPRRQRSPRSSRARSVSRDPTEASAIYTLSHKSSCEERKPRRKKCHKRREIMPNDDTTAWVYTNKRTQYADPEAPDQLRCVDKSTSYIEWRALCETKPNTVRFDATRLDHDYDTKKYDYKNSSSPADEITCTATRTEKRPSQISTIFRRISAFFHQPKKTHQYPEEKYASRRKSKYKDYSRENLSESESLCKCKKALEKKSSTCCKKVSSSCCKKKSKTKKASKGNSCCRQKSCGRKSKSNCCNICCSSATAKKQPSTNKLYCNNELCPKKSSSGSVCCKKRKSCKRSSRHNLGLKRSSSNVHFEIQDDCPIAEENQSIKKTSSTSKKSMAKKPLVSENIKDTHGTQAYGRSKSQCCMNLPATNSSQELSNCKCCYEPSRRSSSSSLQTKKLSNKSKMNISSEELDNMSKSLQKQHAEIECLKQLVVQCLERLDSNMICFKVNQKQFKLQKKLRKKEEKCRKKQMKLLKKQEKHLEKMRKKKEKAQGKVLKYPKNNRMAINEVLGDGCCKCCKCGQPIERCKCSGSEINMLISKGPKLSDACSSSNSFLGKSNKKSLFRKKC